MATATIQITGLEKLKPATAIGGLIAEVAEVTRFYNEDEDTGVRAEYGTPIINVLWGTTVADKVLDLAKQKLSVQQFAADKLIELEKAEAELSKSAVAVLDEIPV